MHRFNAWQWRAAAAALVWLTVPSLAWGLINVNFTPVDLVVAAKSIAAYTVTPDADSGVFRLKLDQVLKGKQHGVKAINVSALSEEDDVAVFLSLKAFRVVVFQGDFRQAKTDGQSRAVAALHMGSSWFAIEAGAEGGLKLAEDTLDLNAVWDGGSEQLIRAVKYVLIARAPRLPTTSGVAWRGVSLHGRISGRVGRPVRAWREGVTEVLYPSTAGDVLAAIRSGQVSLKKLPTKSKLATRADLDGDGAAEWIGYDGDRISALGQAAPKPVCSGLSGVLSLMPTTVRGRSALVGVTATGAVLVEASGGGQFAARNALPNRLEDIRGGKVFDCNGDGLPDLILIAGEALYVAAGTKGGQFGAAKRVAYLYDLKVRSLVAAEFDGDGRVDLLLAGADAGGLYFLRGDGKGGFAGALDETGELSYHGAHPMNAASVGDVNNDGLLDVVLTPLTGPPMVFFSRGFGTFGFSRKLDLTSSKLKGISALARAEGKEPAVGSAILVDVDGDGAQDLLCESGGRLVSVLRQPAGAALGLRVRLSERLAGPVTVTAAIAGRAIGGGVIDSAGGVFFGRNAKGPVDLAWKLPDGGAGKKRVIVLRATECVIGP